VSDKLLKAVAENGGIAGVVAYPPFASTNKRPTIDDMLDMVDYMVNLMGIDHVTFGLDYDATMHGVISDEVAKKMYDQYVAAGVWTADAYPAPPYYYPQGIEFPSTLYNLTDGLLKRGYSKEDIAKLWGGNWMRVMEQVWSDPKASEIHDEEFHHHVH
jgi:membrane dipeptidase